MNFMAVSFTSLYLDISVHKQLPMHRRQSPARVDEDVDAVLISRFLLRQGVQRNKIEKLEYKNYRMKIVIVKC